MQIGKRTFDLPLFVGFFISSVFILLGAIGCVVWGPEIADFMTGGRTWARAEGTVLSSSIDTAARKGKTLYRPLIEVQLADGTIVKGFDMSNMWSMRAKWMDEVVDRYPVGSKVEVMLSPRQPGRMAVERGSFVGGLTMCIPVLFLGLGIMGMIVTLFRGTWIAKGRPSHGLWKFAPCSDTLDLLFRRGYYLWIAIFVLVFVSVIGGLLYFGVREGDFILVGLGLFIAYSFWKAAFPFFRNQAKAGRKPDNRSRRRKR